MEVLLTYLGRAYDEKTPFARCHILEGHDDFEPLEHSQG